MKVLLKNGLIVNGKNEPAFVGNIIIEGEKIIEITKDEIREFTGKIIDCTNLVVAPGFIDAHSHNDWFVYHDQKVDFAKPLLSQGVTSIITGNCGFSATGYDNNQEHIQEIGSDIFTLDQKHAIPDFKKWLENLNHHTPLNVATYIGHGSVRSSINGLTKEEMTKEDYQKMLDLMEYALQNGAIGISVGLMYRPGIFVKKEELYDIGRLCKKYNKTMAFHARANSAVSMSYKSLFGRPHLLRALDEIADIAKTTGCKVQNSHLIFVGKKSWKCVDESLQILQQINQNGSEAAFDMYSYPLGASTITVILPAWYQKLPLHKRNKFFVRLRLSFEIFMTKKLLGFDFDDIQIAYLENDKEYIGKNIAQIAKEKKQSKLKTYLELCTHNHFEGRVYMYKYYNEEIIEKLAKNEMSVFMSDAWLQTEGIQNPAFYNCFVKFLRLTRENKLHSLEETIYKMSGKTASLFQLEKRGTLVEGNYADITIFDYQTIAENKKGDDYPLGIKHVFINGKHVLEDQVINEELFANSGQNMKVKK